MTPEVSYAWEEVKSWNLKELLSKARRLSWGIHGRRLDCFVPGQMVYLGEKGRYPAISLTGGFCALHCDHCNRRVLEEMIPAGDPEDLRRVCRRLDEEGNEGVLLSGGSDKEGALPWNEFLESIGWIKQNTRLRVTIHTGMVDYETALALEEAGTDEVLIDVVGCEETMNRVYHLPEGLGALKSSLEALAATQLPVIPHIVVGLHYGEIKGEMKALDMVAGHPISTLVIVVLRPTRNTPMAGIRPPVPEVVARMVAAARLRLPRIPIALSCARPPGRHRIETDTLCLEAGVNRIAMPAEEVVERARELGLAVKFHKTCCSYGGSAQRQSN